MNPDEIGQLEAELRGLPLHAPSPGLDLRIALVWQARPPRWKRWGLGGAVAASVALATVAAGVVWTLLVAPSEPPPAILRPGQVVGRHVFYSGSTFDGDDPAANRQDDEAIAPDKVALMPGGTATFANYTSYSRGINGLIVDIDGLPDGTQPDAADFRLRVGNDNHPARWAAAPPPSIVTVRPGEGAGGSDRVTIIWSDNAIQKQWLQVTVRATANTGLVENEIFYFGNAVGESGNSATDAKVNAYDMAGARDNQRTPDNPAPIDFHFDYNRDGQVDTDDVDIARENQTHFLNALKLITVPGGKAAADRR